MRVVDVKAKDLKEGMKVFTVDAEGKPVFQPLTNVATKYSFSILRMKLEVSDKTTRNFFFFSWKWYCLKLILFSLKITLLEFPIKARNKFQKRKISRLEWRCYVQKEMAKSLKLHLRNLDGWWALKTKATRFLWMMSWWGLEMMSSRFGWNELLNGCLSRSSPLQLF